MGSYQVPRDSILWQPDSDSLTCRCGSTFSPRLSFSAVLGCLVGYTDTVPTVNRHHCRACGILCCKKCATPGTGKQWRCTPERLIQEYKNHGSKYIEYKEGRLVLTNPEHEAPSKTKSWYSPPHLPGMWTKDDEVYKLMLVKPEQWDAAPDHVMTLAQSKQSWQELLARQQHRGETP